MLELVEGPTLADRIAKGPIPLDEALPIAKQIAEALEAAHEAGVIHRDLKPANIKVRDDGTVKVLDFGLAKALDPNPEGDPSDSPTLTAAVTQMGVIMGTAAYMSPEQAAGQTSDKRSDIWSFGVVLFEMLTGQRLFTGETVSHVLAAVLRADPDWNTLPKYAPTPIARLLRRCLERNPKRRLHGIGEARFVIEEGATALLSGEVAIAAAVRPGVWQRHVPLTSGALALVIVGLMTFWFGWRLNRPTAIGGAEAFPTRTTLDLVEAAPLAFDAVASGGIDSPLLEISPDGITVVYVGQAEGESRLYVRRLDSFDVRPLEGTEGAIHPFFSPDGEAVGFLTNDKVKTVSLSGGSARVLCDAITPIVGTWLADGSIYFGDKEGVVLARVPAEGGRKEEILTARNEFYGKVLPDGQHVFSTFLTGSESGDYAEVRVVSLATGEPRTLIPNGYDARYVPPGYILFGRAGDLLAVRFDANRLEVLDEPQRVASDVRMDALFRNVQVAASAAGVVAYVPGGDAARGKLAWVDRSGDFEFVPMAEQLYGQVDLAPDGQRFAVHVLDVRDYIQIYETGVGATTRLEGQGSENYGHPRWSRQDDKVAFTETVGGDIYQVLVQTLNSSQPPESILAMEGEPIAALAWGPDDSKVVVQTWPQMRRFFAPIEDSTPLPAGFAVRSEFGGFMDLDPSDRWVAAYTGQDIEVRALDGQRVYVVSQGFGTEPRWCRACDELFYRSGNQIFSVKVRFEPEFEWETPELAFEVEGFIDTNGLSYDVSPDGQRLLVVRRERMLPRNTINVIQDWTAAFERP